MKKVWTLVAAAALLAAPLAAAPVRADDAAVRALSVVPANGRTEVVIAIDGAVEVQDFTLASPHRIVLDIRGATLGLAPTLYDRIKRGGVTNVRVAQFRPDVVRLVIDVDTPRQYEIVRGEGEVRITIEGASDAAAWRTAPATESVAAAPASATAAPSTTAHAAISGGPMVGRSRSSDLARTPQQSTQPRITVTYQDADIRDVLAAFAAFSGRTIVVGREVEGSVTAEIRDQPWDVALRAILTAQGLDASEDQNGIITVDSYKNILAKQASEPTVTQLISVNYARAGTLIGTVQALLSKECAPATPGQPQSCTIRGSVTADTSTNTLLVTEVPSRMDDLLAYVRALDVRTPQVAIKAKIILINRTALEQFNIAYDIGGATGFNGLITRTTTGEGTISLGGNILTGIANASSRIPNPALKLAFSTAIGNYSITSFLDATRSISVSDIQAEPTIVTLDNQKAEILVGEETPIRVIDASAGTGGGGGGLPRANVQFKETGIILSVTPHITNNRRVLMQVHAERSNIEQLAAGDLGFFFRKERADNQLLVNDGETAVIGGLTRTTVTRSRAGIPFLVDLPIIGHLFGNTLTNEVKQDLLILITPHIIDEGEAVAPPGSGR